jgi:hypothetical protein
MYNNLWRIGASGVVVLRYDDLNEEAKHVATGIDEVSRLRGTGWEEVEAMAQTVCVMVESRTASGWRRSLPTATGRESTFERARIVLASADRGRRSGWHKAWASAGRRCGGGNNALPKRGSRVWFAR